MEKENIMVVEYTANFGWGGGGDVDMVAIFNKTAIQEKEVKQLISIAKEDNRVIHMTKTQYENVFGKLG